MPMGTYGDITVANVGPSSYKARARYRDRDGQTRTVARFGQTKGQARDRLKAALAERSVDNGGAIGRRTTVRDLAAAWLLEVEGSKRAPNTKRLYRHAVEHWIIPAIGGVRVGELSTSTVDLALTGIAAKHGPSAAKTARAVLNGLAGLAARRDALTVNPVRETSPIPTPRKISRALTVDEVDDLTDRLRTDKRALHLDIPDLIDMGLATGVRIGEALAIRDTVLDLEAGTVEINATVIRIGGQGLLVQERPKTAAGWRVLALPSYAVEMLRRRKAELRFQPPTVTVLGTDGKTRLEPLWLAYPAPAARALRDPSNCAGDLRETLHTLGYEWATFHTFRKTVATRLDQAGMTPREIADQLGHAKPSMTQDVYMGRRVVSARAAEALDR